MRTRIEKWGDGLAVRIPRSFAVEAGLEPDADVEMTVVHGSLIVAPVARRAVRLADLLDRVTADNVHEEIGESSAVGGEAC